MTEKTSSEMGDRIRREIVSSLIRDKGLTPRRVERALSMGESKRLAEKCGVYWGDVKDLATRWGITRDEARKAFAEKRRLLRIKR